jgi:SAM-dependent methyltransferase
MSQKVDLYDTAYGNYQSQTYRQVRIETYGEDLGQTSWVTPMSPGNPRLLDLKLNSTVLELGCGSGGYALHLAEKVGCRLVGLDINAPGVRNANQLALARGLASQARFEQCDVSDNLPSMTTPLMPYSRTTCCAIFLDGHGVGRDVSHTEAGGRMLFSDALVVGGMLSHEEIATRSSIGFYVYSPPEKMNDSLSAPGFARSVHRHNRERSPDREAMASGTGEKETGTGRNGRRRQLRGAATVPVLCAYFDQRKAPAEVSVLCK